MFGIAVVTSHLISFFLVDCFCVINGSHPKIMDMYIKLEELGQKLISIGYVPKTEHVFHNVTDREKKRTS
jgi:hypothetical protein